MTLKNTKPGILRRFPNDACLNFHAKYFCRVISPTEFEVVLYLNQMGEFNFIGKLSFFSLYSLFVSKFCIVSTLLKCQLNLLTIFADDGSMPGCAVLKLSDGRKRKALPQFFLQCIALQWGIFCCPPRPCFVTDLFVCGQKLNLIHRPKSMVTTSPRYFTFSKAECRYLKGSRNNLTPVYKDLFLHHADEWGGYAVVEQVDVVVGGVYHRQRLPVSAEDTLPLPDPRHDTTLEQHKVKATSSERKISESCGKWKLKKVKSEGWNKTAEKRLNTVSRKFLTAIFDFRSLPKFAVCAAKVLQII